MHRIKKYSKIFLLPRLSQSITETNKRMSDTNQPEKQATTISLKREILEEARRIAVAERRSLSAQIELWIDEKIDEAAKAEASR